MKLLFISVFTFGIISGGFAEEKECRSDGQCPGAQKPSCINGVCDYYCPDSSPTGFQMWLCPQWEGFSSENGALSCSYWAGQKADKTNRCDESWSQHSGCFKNKDKVHPGKIRDTCRRSCNNCNMCSDCDTCYFNGHCYPWEKSIALIGCKGGVCTGGAGEICRGRDCRGVGSWGEWGEFSTCTETCGPNGRKTRTRVCNCPSDPCKEPCVGESQQIDTCNRTPCEFTTTIGFCDRTHKLLTCLNRNLNSPNDCKQFCTSQESCVGYSHKWNTADIYCQVLPEYCQKIQRDCHIFPKDGNCPSEFETLNTKKATSPNDLKSDGMSGWVCNIKNSECQPRDNDACLQNSPKWGDKYVCSNTTQSGNSWCTTWGKDTRRCCPESCDSAIFTEEDCKSFDGDGTCIYPKETLCKGDVDGQWGEWQSSACSKSCGGGQQTRNRECNNPSPTGFGRVCIGNSEDTIDCNVEQCPDVDGQWGVWHSSACSKSCGDGKITRSRECNNPAPSGLGRDCIGNSEETQDCNVEECPQVCHDIKIATRRYGYEINYQMETCTRRHVYGSWKVYVEKCCLPAGTYTMVCKDSWGDGWHGAYLEIDGIKYCKDFMRGRKKSVQVIFN